MSNEKENATPEEEEVKKIQWNLYETTSAMTVTMELIGKPKIELCVVNRLNEKPPDYKSRG